MIMDSNKHKAAQGPLETVLMGAYNVSELRTIYNEALLKSRRQSPPSKPAKKAQMVEEFLALDRDFDAKVRFVQHLPPLFSQACSHLIWEKRLSLDAFEKSLGYPIANTLSTPNHYTQNLELKPGFEWLAIEYKERYFYHRERTKADAWVYLPPALRTFLTPAFPKPEGYDLRPSTETPELDDPSLKLRYYDCSQDSLYDLTQIADYLSRGTLKTTKNGKLSKSVFREAANLSKAGEFFPEQKGAGKLPDLRHELLIQILLGSDLHTLQNLASRKTPPSEILSNLLKQIEDNPELLCNELLPHIRKRYSYATPTFSKDKVKNLISIFKSLPANGWITQENLHSYQRYRDIDCIFFDSYDFRYKAEEILQSNTYYRYNYNSEIDSLNQNELVTKPLINGFAFVLAATGLVEIAYTLPPVHKSWHAQNREYLTHCDGFRALRLTELGRYAFGLSKELTIKIEAPTRCEMSFHPERLHLTCKNLDPVTQAALNEYMEPLAPAFYRMTRASFLKGCSKIMDLRKRVADFRQRIPETLPENWIQFLSDLEKEKPALQSRRSLRVFELADNPQLRAQFTTDPLLRRKSIHAEGWRVLIAEEDLTAVKRRLKELGYIADV